MAERKTNRFLFKLAFKKLEKKRESKSIIIDTDKNFGRFLLDLQKFLESNGIKNQSRWPVLHVELLNNNSEIRKDNRIFNTRMEILNGRYYKMTDPKNYDIYGSSGLAVVFFLGDLPGYNKLAHITLGYYATEEEAALALEYIRQFLELIKNI